MRDYFNNTLDVGDYVMNQVGPYSITTGNWIGVIKEIKQEVVAETVKMNKESDYSKGIRFTLNPIYLRKVNNPDLELTASFDNIMIFN